MLLGGVEKDHWQEIDQSAAIKFDLYKRENKQRFPWESLTDTNQ